MFPVVVNLKSCSKELFHGCLVQFSFYKANYASLFATEFETSLMTDKNVASCQTNSSIKHYFKRYKQRKWTLKHC